MPSFISRVNFKTPATYKSISIVLLCTIALGIADMYNMVRYEELR